MPDGLEMWKDRFRPVPNKAPSDHFDIGQYDLRNALRGHDTDVVDDESDAGQRVRALVAMLLVGCGHPSDPVVDDGPTSTPPDATDLLSCSPPNGSANIVLEISPLEPSIHTTKVYSRLVAGVFQRPYSNEFKLELLFTDSSPLTAAAAQCCLRQGPPLPEGEQGCCSVPSLAATVDVLYDGGAPGNHQASLGSRGWDSGTLRITDYTSPFTAPPGRVAGTLTGRNNDLYVDATFDAPFCEGLLVTH